MIIVSPDRFVCSFTVNGIIQNLALIMIPLETTLSLYRIALCYLIVQLFYLYSSFTRQKSMLLSVSFITLVQIHYLFCSVNHFMMVWFST